MKPRKGFLLAWIIVLEMRVLNQFAQAGLYTEQKQLLYITFIGISDNSCSHKKVDNKMGMFLYDMVINEMMYNEMR